ncbi:MAG TPA: thermonuclease family protein [Planctomycetota bacterium]|nr:thermonuclease family protein [Planctomycetota bacterium]
MRLTITLILVFLAGIAVGLLMHHGQSASLASDRRGFGFRLDAGDPQPVVKVIDGDTIELENGLHVRLLGIDSPELGRYTAEVQPCALAARDRLTQLIGNRPVRLEFTDDRIDRHGRLLAHIYTADPNDPGGQVDLSQAMVASGLARAFDYRGPTDAASPGAAADPLIDQLRLAEQAARDQHHGLWGLRRGDPAVEADANGRKWVFVAASDSEVFHRADTAAALAIPADKLIGFPNRDAALQSGRRDAGQVASAATPLPAAPPRREGVLPGAP